MKLYYFDRNGRPWQHMMDPRGMYVCQDESSVLSGTTLPYEVLSQRYGPLFENLAAFDAWNVSGGV